MSSEGGAGGGGGAGGARSAAGDKANPQIIKSVLEERDLIIGIDAHGIYSPASLEHKVEIPKNLIVIEIGLPTQYTYAKYYDYMYAIFIKPILLNYLYDSTSEMDNLYKMLKRGVDLYSYSDIYIDKDGQEIQKNLLYGNYDVLRNPRYKAMDDVSKREFESKLETLSEVVKNLTIYMPGESITSRAISAYEHPHTRPDQIDTSCGVDVIDEYTSTIWKKDNLKKLVKNEDEDVEFLGKPDPLKPLLDPIFVHTGILTGAIIEGLGEFDKKVKLIIFTCSTIDSDANLDDTDTNELIESVTRVRRKLQAERSNNSGPGIAAIGRKQVVDERGYNKGNWCINTPDDEIFNSQPSILRFSIAEFHDSALTDNTKHVTSNNESNESNANSSNEYCSPTDYYSVTRFIYLILEPHTKDIIKPSDGDIQIKKPTGKPFINFSLRDVLTKQAKLYDSLYLISKEKMTLYKVSYILNDYITEEDIQSNQSGIGLLLLEAYQDLAAQYILQPFQVSEKEDYQHQRVISFDKFRYITIEYINKLLKVNELYNKLENIEMNKSGRIYIRDIMRIYTKFEFSYFGSLQETFKKLVEYKELDKVEKIIKYIERYKELLYRAIQYLVYISTTPVPTDADIIEWEKDNYIEIDETNDPIQNACIAFYKETCEEFRSRYNDVESNGILSNLNTPMPPMPPMPAGSKRPRGYNPTTRNTKRRRAHKTRRKNRK